MAKTSKEKLQLQQEYRYRQDDPVVTIAHDYKTDEGKKVKITGKMLKASELYDYLKSSNKNGFYLSLNTSINPEIKGSLNSEASAENYYTIFIDIDNSELNPFIGCPLKPSSISKCTNGLGWHAEFFIDVMPFTPENKISYQLIFDTIKSWFIMKGFTPDNTKDVGRFCRIPYSPHNKPGKELFYYEILKVRKLYYSLEKLEKAFSDDLNAEAVYNYCVRHEKSYEAGERQDILYKKAIKLFSNGIPEKRVVEYLYKFSDQFCNPPHDEDDRPEVERQAARGVEFINMNGGPKNVIDKIKNTKVFRLDQGGFIERMKYYLSEGEIIYNINNKSWYRFKDKYWIDNRMPLYSLITEIVDIQMVEEKEIALIKLNKMLTDKKVDSKEAKKATLDLEKRYNNEIKNAHSTYYKDAIMKQLAEQTGFSATEEAKALDLPVFNQIHHKFNFANGSFNFQTMELESPNYKDFSTVMTPYNYDPEAKNEQFQEFLNQILDQGEENRTKELVEWMQIFLGSCLIGGENRNKVFPVWYGHGDNGKSTFVDIISTVFNEYAGSIRAESITSKADSNRFEMSDVPNKRFLIANESKEGAFLNVALVKAMTGNDLLKCERKGSGHFDFKPSFKIILLTNNKPAITEKTEAIWSRVKLVPFLVTIPKKDQNLNIKQEILADASGVVNWLVDGAKKWIENNFELPEATCITDATAEYKQAEDSLQNWIDDACEVLETAKAGDTVKDLYHAFIEDTGSKMGRKKFSKELEKLGPLFKEKYQSYQFNLKLIYKDAENSDNMPDIIEFEDAVPF